MNRKSVEYVVSLIIVFTMLVGAIIPSGIAAPKNTVFADISNHWAKDKISRWVNMGIVSGYQDSTFKPDKTI